MLRHAGIASRSWPNNAMPYRASAGVATVIRGWFNSAARSRAKGLDNDEQVLLGQNVGRKTGRAAAKRPRARRLSSEDAAGRERKEHQHDGRDHQCDDDQSVWFESHRS